MPTNISSCYFRSASRRKEHTKRRELRKQSRLKIIELLGGKCIRCGFLDYRALQVDHVNGDALKDLVYQSWLFGMKKIHKIRATEELLKAVETDVKNGTGIFQCLCANCNWIKRYELEEHV